MNLAALLLASLLALPSAVVLPAAVVQETTPPVVTPDPQAEIDAVRAGAEAARQAQARYEIERAELEARVAGAAAATAALEAAPLPPPLALTPGQSSAELDGLLQAGEEARSAARAQLDAAQAERVRLEARRATLPTELAAERERADELARRAAPVAPPDAGQFVRERALAEVDRLEANRGAARERVRRLEVEAQGLEALVTVATAEEDAAKRLLARLDADVAALDRARSERLAQEGALAEDAARKQARQAALQSESLKIEADINLALAEERGKLARRLAELADAEPAARARLESLKERRSDTQERVEQVGLTDAVGLHLRQERLSLGDARDVRARLRDIDDELSRKNLRRIELRRDLQQLPTRDEWVAKEVAGVSGDSAVAAEVAGELWSARRENLEVVRGSTREAIDALFQLRIDERQYLVELEQYQGYVEERVLWVRSAAPIWQVAPATYLRDAQRLADVERWAAIGASLGDDARADLSRVLLGALGVALLFLLRPGARRRLTEEGTRARQRTQVGVRPTLRAVLWSLMLAAPPVALVGFVSWRLGAVLGAGSWAGALGDGCSRAASQVAILAALRAVFARDGLADAHFDWPEKTVRTLRRGASWLFYVLPLATFLGVFLATLDGSEGADALGRIATLVGIIATGVFVWRLLHPERGVLAPRGVEVGLMQRLRRLWFVLAVGVVAGLVLLTSLGYAFSARQLFERFEFTLALVLAVAVTQGLAERALLLARKREALERLRRRREELRAKHEEELEARRAAGEEIAEEDEDEGLTVGEESLDFGALTEDARKLVRTSAGLAMLVLSYLIWSSALPALGALDAVKLWDERVPDLTGTGITEVPVTLRNILFALFVLALGALATRSLPSVLEITVLQRFKLATGERHAITTLVRYAVTIIVFVMAFDQLGVPWAKAQWLVAGVSVGLGFGLQEIFANFVSGLVLLFERPIRVGDWVTLGEVEGVVSRIRIRATTIRDRDLRELVVPNKEFVTGRFINWTLTDSVTRVICRVGIAYGSDTERAVKILLECGRTSPYQVEEPSPNVVFKAFGDSSLDFELRVFVNGRDIQPRVVHDLHMRIDAAFREAHIEIAFPQRDLHVRSLGPIERHLERRPVVPGDAGGQGAAPPRGGPEA